jgi:hypothetical protein
VAIDYFDYAKQFLHSYRQLPSLNGPNWPKYFLFTHSIELVIKSFLIRSGVEFAEIQNKFGHNIEKLLCEAQSKGLQLPDKIASEILLLHEIHSKHWARYPKFNSKPVFVIEEFEASADALFSFVSQYIFQVKDCLIGFILTCHRQINL